MVVEVPTRERVDEVDVFLASQDGQVQRPKGPDCRHPNRQKCTNCLPVDPFDEEYLKEKDIKHMSFHSHIRKLLGSHGKGTTLKRPLENIRCSINPNCGSHKPFPKGICTLCKPPVVTLNRQKYRHVDNIQIENQNLVNRFLDYWRISGNQRVGYLIGQYQPHLEVPLGIKATVAAIYEPPQHNKQNGIELISDPNEEIVDKLLDYLGLQRVGWIFTDCWTANGAEGTVHHTRHKDSFFLSAEECITAAALQNKYKNVTDFCMERYFGSKFVTIVASGDESLHVNFHGYQVSNQCAAMVEADILCPTLYTPELAYVRETPLSDKHYITDVQYMEKNEYGAEVIKNGRPLPVEYLLVDVPAGMPKEMHYTFHVDKANFNVENRQDVGQIQNGQNLAQYCAGFSMNQFLEQATNFHFLLYLMTNDVQKISDDWMKRICDAVKSQNRGDAMDWSRDCVDYHQLVALSHADAHDAPSNRGQTSAGSAVIVNWQCKHCTFENEVGKSDCAMCGLPNE